MCWDVSELELEGLATGGLVLEQIYLMTSNHKKKCILLLLLYLVYYDYNDE